MSTSQWKQSDESDQHKLHDIVSRLSLGELLHWYQHLKPTTVRALASYMAWKPVGDAASSHPPELESYTALQVFLAYKSMHVDCKDLNHGNYVQKHIGAIPYTDSVKVEYTAKDRVATITKEAEEKTEEVAYPMIGTQAVGTIADVKLTEGVASACERASALMNFESLVPTPVFKDYLNVVQKKRPQWLEQLDKNASNIKIGNHSNVVYALQQNVLFMRGLSSMREAKPGVYRLPTFKPDLNYLENIMRAITPDRASRKIVDSIDAPFVDSDFLLRMGALSAWITDVGFDKPVTLQKCDVYGVGGIRCARLYDKCNLYDLKPVVKPPIKSTATQEMRNIMDKFFPEVKVKDVLECKEGENVIISNAWAAYFEDKHIIKLLELVFSTKGVFRFKCAFTTLVRLIEPFFISNPKTKVCILNFGRASRPDIFLTACCRGPIDGRWAYKVANFSEFKKAMQVILLGKCQLVSHYVVHFVNEFSQSIRIEGRPFVIKNWMWPMTVGMKSIKSIAFPTQFSVSDLGLNIPGVVQLTAEDFAHSLDVRDVDRTEHDVEDGGDEDNDFKDTGQLEVDDAFANMKVVGEKVW
jgi:hypothetical protein